MLRFFKIITPVRCVTPFYDGNIKQPKEGEPHRRSRARRQTVRAAWSVNIDKAKGTPIRGLRCNGRSAVKNSIIFWGGHFANTCADRAYF